MWDYQLYGRLWGEPLSYLSCPVHILQLNWACWVHFRLSTIALAFRMLSFLALENRYIYNNATLAAYQPKFFPFGT